MQKPTTDYPLNRRISRRLAVLGGVSAAAVLVAGCHAHRSQPSARGLAALDTSGGNSLRFAASSNGLLTGFAVAMEPLRHDAEYARIVREQSSILVAENAMKRAQLQPESNRYVWDDADFVIAFAEKHRIKARGHTLVWHEGIPAWLQRALNRESARRLMVDHIRTVVSRYAGRIHSWDVVNEAIATQQCRPDGLRRTPWLSLVGDDYLELAYRTAREADPAALLTYNEDGLDTEGPEAEAKRAATLLLLRRLKARNVPIDAVGLQAHLTASPGQQYGAGLQRFLASCRSLDLQVFVTEMDVDDRILPGSVEARDYAVAQVYRDYLAVVLPDPAVRAVLTWGLTDRSTWLNDKSLRGDGLPQRPLLFDPEYRPTPAYAAVRDAFQNRAVFGKISNPVQNYDPIRPSYRPSY